MHEVTQSAIDSVDKTLTFVEELNKRIEKLEQRIDCIENIIEDKELNKIADDREKLSL